MKEEVSTYKQQSRINLLIEDFFSLKNHVIDVKHIIIRKINNMKEMEAVGDVTSTLHAVHELQEILNLLNLHKEIK